MRRVKKSFHNIYAAKQIQNIIVITIFKIVDYLKNDGNSNAFKIFIF